MENFIFSKHRHVLAEQIYAELVLAGSGINLWREWAKIEILRGEGEYKCPEAEDYYAGIITSLAKQEWPDLSAYNDPEIVWRLDKSYHAGFVLRSKHHKVIEQMLGELHGEVL